MSLGDCRINANYTKHHLYEIQAIEQAITVKAIRLYEGKRCKRESGNRERENAREKWGLYFGEISENEEQRNR